MPDRSTDTMPEGTDTIIAGASGSPVTAGGVATPSAIPTGGDTANAADGGDADQAFAPTAGAGDTQDGGLRARAAAATAGLREQAGERTAELRGQAGDKAREFAEQGKERATEALDNVARLIADAAEQVDEKVGREYGDYARRAAGAVENLSGTLRDKDVDALFADARELVRRSPGIAMGAATVFGFALIRLVKAGAADAAATADADTQPPRTGKAPSKKG